MYQYSRAAQMLLAYAASAAPSSRDACFPVATGFSNQTHRFASVVPSTVIPLISTAVEAPRHLVARVMEEERMRAAAQERMELAAIEKRDIGSQHVTFSFGKNWWNFLYRLKPSMVEKAQADITQWLGNVRKLRVIDVGSGSGLASLSFLRLGASEVVSIDVDKYSVAATMRLRANQSGSFSGEWKVYQGSVLDQNFIWSLGRFDVVHSWGVLHHTGGLHRALANLSPLVRGGGKLLVTLYQGGRLYPAHLALKQQFNRANAAEKLAMIDATVKRRKLTPAILNRVGERGMTTFNNIVDWLGGLPYEVAYGPEIRSMFQACGFKVAAELRRKEGRCSYFLFNKLKGAVLAA
jgi:2-polyprenyl-3-methyl-5-hydroxy-6-metoxy-1,4-benzoquinol methylase